MILRVTAFVLLAFAAPAAAVELSLPQSARLTVERNTGPDSYVAPVGPFLNGTLDTVTVEGDVARSAWRLETSGLTPLQVLRPLRSQLTAAGYDIVLDCGAVACGGFDFRFAVETLPGPNMYVNIRSYHFVTAVQGPLTAPTSIITVLASTAASSAYVQIIQADAVGTVRAPGAPASDPGGNAIAELLLSQGHAVLGGLDFTSGTATLGDAGAGTLERLATFLKDQPTVRIALVGHTDSVGALDPNIALSRSRAAAVRDRLVESYGISGDQIEAEGMGYLAPVASNLTAQGREDNRRVEAVLLSRD
ncbi:OmpA-OmpF porin, OOP family [Sulfitobacter marinus]|uniref:OmpA-OmpF porin, OOP family n=1 Tax=Sulfitobacter marinus TaxID=394264 RepID=A0A1I6UZ04_9RHOB|nr:OmpA family protein [Sulfitobacter marinus]SFT06652.1 OmpA-OmpF porin, OOP family [Sulfitobacter marinus]